MQAIDENILDAENPELISIDELTLDDWEANFMNVGTLSSLDSSVTRNQNRTNSTK